MNDLERFLRSDEGKARLNQIQCLLKGKTIVDIRFSNDVHFLSVLLDLDNGDTFSVTQSSLSVVAIREKFADVIEREYYVDFPERRPR